MASHDMLKALKQNANGTAEKNLGTFENCSAQTVQAQKARRERRACENIFTLEETCTDIYFLSLRMIRSF